jgi:hypothetical protein
MKKLFSLILNFFKKKHEHKDIGFLPREVDTIVNLKIERDHIDYLQTSKKQPKHFTGTPQTTINTTGTVLTINNTTYPTVPIITVDNITVPYTNIVTDVRDYGCVYINFNGNQVRNLGKVAFTETQKQMIMEAIGNRFRQINIIVSANPDVFAKANPLKRCTIFIGNSNGANAGFGGMTYGNESDVYWDRMGGSLKNTGEECVHEAGHAGCNLNHHVRYDANGNVIEEYCSQPNPDMTSMGYPFR